MSRPQLMRLGPFVGGMNNYSDVSAIADNELVDCVNLDLDLDGSLLCRPPINETAEQLNTTRFNCIGTATIGANNYVFFSSNERTVAWNGSAYTTISTTMVCRAAVQFQDFVYFIATPGSSVNGGYWDGTTFTTDADIPRGEAGLFHKSRLWVVPGSSQTGAAAHQLKFSDPLLAGGNIAFPAANVIGIGQGDGQKLVDIQVYNDNLILFKQDSIYVLAYDVAPADAVLRKVNDTIGAITRRCTVTYENSIFILYKGAVYEMVNYDFKKVSEKVPFVRDTSVPASTTRLENVCLFIVKDKLLTRYHNRLYSYNLRTKTWARHESANDKLHNIGFMMQMPADSSSDDNFVWWGGSTIQQHLGIYSIKNNYDTTTAEKYLSGGTPTAVDITCKITTKDYDFGDEVHFKKLLWWGADVISTRDEVGITTPVIANFSTTWDDVGASTWDSLAAFTWDNALIAAASIQTNVTDAIGNKRKFIKFLKSFRFRLVGFQVKLLCNGTTTQGPARVFTLTAIVGAKQVVVKQIS